MINAQEARELVKNSNRRIETIISTLEILIQRAAMASRSTVCTSDIEYLTDCVCIEKACTSTPTPTQQAVIAVLSGLGFTATIKMQGEPYVPVDLADDQGNGPLYKHVVLEICW